VIILKDHSINGTKEEIQNKSKEPNIKAKEPKLKAKSQSQSKMDNPLKPPYKGLNRTWLGIFNQKWVCFKIGSFALKSGSFALNSGHLLLKSAFISISYHITKEN
jgi:hypothetical protein